MKNVKKRGEGNKNFKRIMGKKKKQRKNLKEYKNTIKDLIPYFYHENTSENSRDQF